MKKFINENGKEIEVDAFVRVNGLVSISIASKDSSSTWDVTLAEAEATRDALIDASYVHSRNIRGL